MKPATPGFYRLFQRGRYQKRMAEDDQSSEAEEVRKERERFAASAVAFCLKHDPVFRQFFWEKVCRVPDDPLAMPPIGAEGIGVEPPRWADISLTFEDEETRLVWVVEVKAGATLQAIQDPRSKSFKLRKVGYGWLFVHDEADSKAKRRYIVFGRDEELDLPEKDEQLGIFIQQRRWSDIADCPCPKTSLVDDLFDCLGSLGIQPFAMNKAKSIAVNKGLSKAGAAHSVLVALCDSLGVKPQQRKFEVYEEDQGTVEGIYIQKPPPKKPSKPHLHLQRTTGSSGDQAWIGYFATKDDEIRRSIYLYCETVKKRDALLEKMKADGTKGANDLEWFKSVFAAAGVGAIAY